MTHLLPTEAADRKKIPLWTGVFKYFPLTMIEVAKLSYVGNEQHNPGEPLHWAREKSTDQEDTLLRHMMEQGTVDTDGIRHVVKCVWRCMAMAELELEAAERETEPDTKLDTGEKAGTFVCTPLNSPNRDCLIHGE